MRLLSPLPATFSAVCLFGARVAFTQSSPNFSVPTSWQNTTFSLSRETRQAIAQSAIQRIPAPAANGNGTLNVSGYQFDHVQTSSLLSVLFLYDFFSGTATNKNSAAVIYEKELDPSTTNMSHILHWGLANYYAYRAYQDDQFLQEAIGSWKNASENMLTQGAIQSGTLEINLGGTSQNTVQIPVPSSSCSPSIGAVFEFPDHDHPFTVIEGETMGAFLALSAYLSGESNETFSEAASLSAEFIQAHMINNSVVNPLHFNMSSDSCAVTPDDQSGMMNIGLIIEGLSVWANQTSNATLSNIVNDLIVQSIKHTWTGSNGVITQESGDPDDDQSGAKAWFIRGLHEAWSRMSDKNSKPASFIAAYITVQFNALHNMSPNGNYSMNWSLPSTNASATFDPWAQVVALDVLNSAFDIVPPATNSTSANPSSPSPMSTFGLFNPPDRSSTSHIGAIAGGTVGGIVVLALAVGAVIYLLRWRRRNRTIPNADLLGEGPEKYSGGPTVVPFVSEAHARPRHLVPVSLALPDGTITTKFRNEGPVQHRQHEAGLSGNGNASAEPHNTAPELLSVPDAARVLPERTGHTPQGDDGGGGGIAVTEMFQHLATMVLGMRAELRHVLQDTEAPPTYH